MGEILGEVLGFLFLFLFFFNKTQDSEMSKGTRGGIMPVRISWRPLCLFSW